MILSTCCYVKKNAGLSFDELHGVVGVAKVGTSALPVALKAVFNRGRRYFRKVAISGSGALFDLIVGAHHEIWRYMTGL